MSVVVVTPLNYREEHEEVNPQCWCGPRLEKTSGGVTLVHEILPFTPATRWMTVHYPELEIPMGEA